MHPDRTTYHLVCTQEEYIACLSLDAANDVLPPPDYAYPMLYASREGDIIAWLSTSMPDGVVVIDEFICALDAKAGAILALRLLEALERLLRVTGIQGYTWRVGSERAPTYHHAAAKLANRIVTAADGASWYVRDLQEVSRG